MALAIYDEALPEPLGEALREVATGAEREDEGADIKAVVTVPELLDEQF